MGLGIEYIFNLGWDHWEIGDIKYYWKAVCFRFGG